MSDTIETPTTETVPAPSARSRADEMRAPLPGLKAGAERVQREILQLAPECAAGNVEAKSLRTKLRAQLADNAEAIADLEAAILALQPFEEAERHRAQAEGVARRAMHVEGRLNARGAAGRKADEFLEGLIASIRECNRLGSEALSLSHGLLRENLVFSSISFGELILLNLVAAGIIGAEYTPPGIMNIARHSIEHAANTDARGFLIHVREGAAKASMSQSELDAQARKRDETTVTEIEQRRLASGMW